MKAVICYYSVFKVLVPSCGEQSEVGIFGIILHKVILPSLFLREEWTLDRQFRRLFQKNVLTIFIYASLFILTLS